MTSIPGKGLIFTDGYVHVGPSKDGRHVDVCGGPAEMGNYSIAFCRTCDTTVPIAEVKKPKEQP